MTLAEQQFKNEIESKITNVTLSLSRLNTYTESEEFERESPCHHDDIYNMIQSESKYLADLERLSK